MKTVRKYRMFNIFQYDQEADFLSEMHRQGYAFVKYSPPFTYIFDLTEPQEVTYQLVYKKDHQDDDTFLQMMADYGFAHLGEYLDYYYFRQPTDQVGQVFFMDQENQINQMQQIMRNRLLPILLFIFILAVVNINDQDSAHALSEGIITIINLMFTLYLIIIAWVGYHYFRLKKRIENGELNG